MLDLKGKRVFVVEDNVMNRAVFSIFFAARDMSVIFDYYGRDTISRLKGIQKVDLIILDLMLTGDVSGFDVFTQIRALPEYDNVPIIVVSAADPITSITKAQELGLNGFIPKPIQENLFADQLISILAGEKIWSRGG